MASLTDPLGRRAARVSPGRGAPRTSTARAGRYRITVIVTDRAGNATDGRRSRSGSPKPKSSDEAHAAAPGATRLAAPDRSRSRSRGRSPLAASAPVRPGPPPTPPTAAHRRARWYRDGQSGRYLLGGHLAVPGRPGRRRAGPGWWRNVASTDGWTRSRSPTPTTPATSPGEHGRLGGLVPARLHAARAGAFDRYVPTADRHWIVRFESVNYRATVWLNGHELGQPRRRLPAVRIRPEPPARRRQPADRPGRQPPHRGRSAARARAAVVELRRHPARGVPACGRRRADLERVQIRPLLPCPRCAATIDEQAARAQPRPARPDGAR